jgi:hypothetical protein
LRKLTYLANNLYVLIPLLGSVVFVLLYFVATLYYPGGSQVDQNAIGFSWINNYWCNLLNDTAINGKSNPAKPIAITGMLVLCITLAYFWWLFPRHLQLSIKWKYTIQISGALSMFIAFFLFTNFNHDAVTNLASIFGLIATAGTFIGLYQTKWYKLFRFGIFNILLVFLNNYVYYSKGLIIYLPIIQKISFVSFLIWVCCIDVTLYRLQKNKL